ncbi:MAG: beta-L-arabinofuranosidase domain-containing protein [Phycisphaerae bacterium]
MRRLAGSVALAAISATHVLAAGGPLRKLQAVPFTEVAVRDAFWAPRIETNRSRSIPHNFKWCRQTGRFSNFAKAGGLMAGGFEGIYFNDSDVYKVLEGASYSLQAHPDPNLDRQVDEVIAWIAAAQRPDGYLNSYYTLKEPKRKWTNCRVRHELYCAGHMFEAAVAHYRATGKKTLLSVAVRFADHIGEIFGPDKRHDVPGHEEIELALVKLAGATGNDKYLKLARFFLDIRGCKSDKRPDVYGPYCQDHLPVTEQSEPTGHAVRAMYLYSGMADVAAATGDRAYVDALGRLWANTVEKKMYITGAIGSTRHGEAFGKDYQLPNDTAYCETCASIGMCLWNHRMNLLHADAKYMDTFERTAYNGFLAGVDLGGEKFFYVNPLASRGRHHRQPFYGCACCPTNVVRFLPSLPGYVYATGDDAIYVNLFAAGTARVKLGERTVTLKQETRYPWDGRVRITVSPDAPADFTFYLRSPGWIPGRTGKDDLHRTEPAERSDLWSMVFTEPRKLKGLENVRGYVALRQTWKVGDVIELAIPMPIQRVYSHAAVEANTGRVALQRGPIVYCIEAADNGGAVSDLYLPRDAKLTAEFRKDLLGGVTVITGRARRQVEEDRVEDVEITAVPYYAWDHRTPGEMAVWIAEDPNQARARPAPTVASRAKATASHVWPSDATDAMNDRIEPKGSSDHSIPRLTWWDHRGTAEWVQYAFKEPTKVRGVEVYWFDDKPRGGGCRAPKSWRVAYKAGEEWRPVAGASEYGTKINQYNEVTFDAVTTTALRIEVQLQPKFSGGILEWRVKEVGR